MSARRKRGHSATPKVSTLGDSAVLLTLADAFDLDANAWALRIAADIRSRVPEWVTDVIPALVTVAVCFDARTAREAQERRTELERLLLESLQRTAAAPVKPTVRTVEIPVCYEGAFAPDLREVAERMGLSAAEIVALHAATPHRVLMIGFAPGQPYIGGLDARLAVPRRSSPRPRVEAGAVAIANAQTTIYPFPTPGGWNVIGRTPLTLFDPTREPVNLLEPGDAIVFAPVSRAEFDRFSREQQSE